MTEMSETFGFRVRGDAVIEGLLLPDTVTLGEVRLTLGEPARITLTNTGFRSQSPIVAWILEYPDREVHVFAEFQVCQTRQSSLWKMRQRNPANDGFLVGVGSPDYFQVMSSRRIELDMQHWAKQLRDMC